MAAMWVKLYSTIFNFLHDLANDNPRIFVVRYTGGTKNGVKGLATIINDT